MSTGNVKIFKIGHKNGDPLHMYGNDVYEPALADGSDSNKLCSEFSVIESIIENKTLMDELPKYVGICHYRCAYFTEEMTGSFQRDFDNSAKMITDLLSEDIDGIYSESFAPNITVGLSRTRWTGSNSAFYAHVALSKVAPELVRGFDKYLNSTEKSYRTICILKKELFTLLFTDIIFMIPHLIQLRSDKGELYPRSVGYDLELLVSFYLIHYSKTHSMKKLNYSVRNYE